MTTALSPASSTQPAIPPRAPISRRRKAAIIVRLLLSEGADLPISALPGDMQAALTAEIGAMRYIDATTLRSVVAEFLEELEKIGLTFPGGIDGALALLDGHISPEAAAVLKAGRPKDAPPDPWPPIAAMEPADLIPLVQAEATEVAAVMLSKLSTEKAATLLGLLPGEQARRVAYAMAMTGSVAPDTVERIGHILLEQLQTVPQGAFTDPPEDRVGAILNLSTAATRDTIIEGLEETDQDFAQRVRKAIFTFADIPARIAPRDAPAIARATDPDTLLTALAGAADGPAEQAAAEFILANMSQRLAAQLREDIADAGPIRPADGEAAMTRVVSTIRDLELAGELTLLREEEDEAAA